jgi:hypothetical protein
VALLALLAGVFDGAAGSFSLGCFEADGPACVGRHSCSRRKRCNNFSAALAGLQPKMRSCGGFEGFDQSSEFAPVFRPREPAPLPRYQVRGFERNDKHSAATAEAAAIVRFALHNTEVVVVQWITKHPS